MTRVDQIVHLTHDLAADARDLLRVPCDIEEPHSWLHANLGAIGRSLRSSRSGVAVHAGACCIDGRAVLVAGATGAGKSTLVTTMCLLLPAEFISDDTVWLSGGYAEGMGAPISVRRGSPWYSIASGLPYGGDLDRILVNPADLGVGFQHGTRAVSHLLFPTYRPYEPSLAAELTPAASFCRLVSSAFRVSRSDEYDELAAVAASARSMSLTYPDSGSSIKLVRRALAMNPLDALIPSRVEPDEMTCEGFGPDTGAIRFGDECAIWNKATGQIAHVAAWPAGRPLRGEVAWTQLESMGFVGGDLP